MIAGQTACKPGSVRRPCGRRDDHSSGPPIAGRFSRPTRTTGPVTILPAPQAMRTRHPYSVLLQAGLAMPSLSPGPRWALTPPFHPSRPAEAGRRFAFCGAIPGVAPGGRYPPPCHRGARTFLDAKAPRPSGRLARGPCAAKGRGRSMVSGQAWSAANRNRATRRALVSPSAIPSTLSGRQWRWKAIRLSLVSSSYWPDGGLL